MGLNSKEPSTMVKEEVNNDGFREIGECMFFLFGFFTCVIVFRIFFLLAISVCVFLVKKTWVSLESFFLLSLNS